MARKTGEIIHSCHIEDRDRLKRGVVSNGIEWKIHYFSCVSLRQCDKYHSPEFKLFGARWYLEICLSSESENDNGQWFGLYLCRINKINDEFSNIIEFTFGIRQKDGVIHNIRSGKKDFGENANRAGVPTFLRRFARKRPSGRRNTFNCTPDNCLIIFCVMNERPSSMISKDEGGSIGVDCESSSSEDEEDSDDQEEELEHQEGIVVLSEDMKKLFDSEQLCDVKILVNGEELHAHKAILAARSPVFFAMFKHEMKEKKSDFVEISDSKLDAFKEFLSYLYTGNLRKVSLMHICDLYVLADKYNVKKLTRECIDIMEENLCVDNFCNFISLAIKYKESELLETMTAYFVENAKSILQTVQWQSFIAENPTVANELFLKTLSLKLL